ncbi:putative urea ABC transporter substrate-binding protein [Halarcobacter anaerophilus]|uniref:Lipid kinase n=1 Tax=Halarcobacter anaerophilus TaxID=877500 RepID=A0A4Q0Y3I7_9BACT|nr:putative urea ABC transporter substrate-binding protein [Halarcobacter anaerophilus]QDF29447.1 urea ABC transporter, substrate-binding protein [Halarcobacter anaerophilus]RXJ64692.1 lipid kinase [Halarcobacter anaerophilus]
MKSSNFTKLFKLLSVIVLFAGLSTTSLFAKTKKDFKIAWSIYVGYMPWPVIDSQKILDKWGKKYGINIDVVQINDYIESINQYSAGKFDGCAMASFDSLSIPAAGGVDSTALILADYSNGNDAILSKTAKTVKELKGEKINLIELSISHYLLARALELNGMSERDIKTENTSDSDMVAAYGTDDVTTVTTWKPQVSEIEKIPNTNNVFNSSNLPGEIMDFFIVNTKTLKDNPAFGKALVGAWYEMMDLMTQKNEKAKEVLSQMATDSGTDLNGFLSQVKTTHFFYTPKEAVEYVNGKKIKDTMKFMAEFSFNHGLYGDGATDYKFVGIEFPNGEVIGDKNNIKLRFDDTYMKMAENNNL